MMQKSINPSLAIGVIIKNAEGKILFVQEGRDKYYEKASNVFGLPAGKVEWTEKIEDGLMREMKEELNIEIKPIGLVGVYQYSRENSQCIGFAITAELIDKEIDINHNKEEIKSTRWLSVDEALSSSIDLRVGVREVLEDYKKNKFLPFGNVHFFDLIKNKE